MPTKAQLEETLAVMTTALTEVTNEMNERGDRISELEAELNDAYLRIGMARAAYKELLVKSRSAWMAIAKRLYFTNPKAYAAHLKTIS